MCRNKIKKQKKKHNTNSSKDLERSMKSSEAGEQNSPALKSYGGHTPKTTENTVIITVSYLREIKTRQQQRKMTENICKNTCLLISVINSTSHKQEKTSPVHE